MMNSVEHLTEEVAAAYVDGRLTGADKKRAQAHLADCAECREEIAAVSDIVEGPRRKRLFVLPVAAAAAIVLVTLTLSQQTAVDPVFRGDPVSEESVVVTNPAEGAALAGPPSFGWRHVRDALEYRLTISNQGGDVVAERVIADTATIVQSIEPGAYRWYVTAILSDGTIRSSRTRAFEVR